MFKINLRSSNFLGKRKSELLRVQLRFSRYYGYTIKNPAWLLMFVLGRINFVRNFVSCFYQFQDLPQDRPEDSLFKGINVEKVVKSLKQDGYYLGVNLPPAIVTEITQLAYSTKIQARNRSDLSFFYADKAQLSAEDSKNIVHGVYVNASSRFAAINKLENDPKLLTIAAQYLGCAPIHIRTDLSWCFTAAKKEYEKYGDAQVLFHYDLDDYHALKFFFFLTDVDLSSGAHVCVRGSHNRKKLRHQFSWLIGRSDREMIEHYGQENLVTICGKAGFGFAEDPFCYHRGSPPQSRDRLMLQIEFAVNNYGMWTVVD